MRKGTRLKLKRRMQGLTYYKRRKNMTLSGKPRLVVRSSDKYVYAYLVESLPRGDKVLSSANSRELRTLGWDFALGNTPASYLTGGLLAKRAEQTGVKEAVLDLGLATPTKGNKLFAVAKGCSDFGLMIKCGESVIPSEDRIKGKHIADYLSETKEGKAFSALRTRNLSPELITQQFEAVVSKIKSGGVT